MIGLRFIWFVGKEGQSGLSHVGGEGGFSPWPQSQWLCCNSKISGGDYRLLRRIQQLSHSRTDVIKSAKLSLLFLSHSLPPYVTCHRAMSHVTLSSALSLSHICSGFACLPASHPGFRVATDCWQNLPTFPSKNKKLKFAFFCKKEISVLSIATPLHGGQNWSWSLNQIWILCGFRIGCCRLKTGSGHRNVPVVRISSDDHRAGRGFRTRSDIAIDKDVPHAAGFLLFAIVSWVSIVGSDEWSHTADSTHDRRTLIMIIRWSRSWSFTDHDHDHGHTL